MNEDVCTQKCKHLCIVNRTKFSQKLIIAELDYGHVLCISVVTTETCMLIGQCHGRDVISPSFGFILLFDC